MNENKIKKRLTALTKKGKWEFGHVLTARYSLERKSPKEGQYPFAIEVYFRFQLPDDPTGFQIEVQGAPFGDVEKWADIVEKALEI